MINIHRILPLALIAVVGCGDPAPNIPAGVEVSGKVQLPSGSPVTGGVLTLRPVQGIHGASAPIQPDGSFTLQNQAGTKTIAPGKYKAFIRFNDPSHKALQAAIGQRYQNTEDGESDIEVDIQTAKNDLLIKFKR
jgi:hypothetical protein